MSTKTRFTNLKMAILWRDNTAHMVFEGELAVKLHAKDVEVGTSGNENSRQDKVSKSGYGRTGRMLREKMNCPINFIPCL